MGLNEWMLKKAAEQQSKMATSLPEKIRVAFRRDIKDWEKKKGRKPTIEEMMGSIDNMFKVLDSNPLYSMGATQVGLHRDNVRKIAEECLDESL